MDTNEQEKIDEFLSNEPVPLYTEEDIKKYKKQKSIDKLHKKLTTIKNGKKYLSPKERRMIRKLLKKGRL